MESHEVHDKIAAIGVRIFKTELAVSGGRRDEMFWVHPDKTTAQWREDLRSFKSESDDPVSFCQEDNEYEGGHATDAVFNGLFEHLRELGYHELDDVVSDVYEGRLTNEQSRLVDDPSHPESMKDGFGHYGWDAKAMREAERQNATGDE